MSLPLWRRTGLSAAPANREGREIIASVPDGETFIMEKRNPRSMPMHRAYFAMLRDVFEASGRWPSQKAMEHEIALELKAGDLYQDHRGNWHFVPLSRAVASMPADDFHQLVRDTEALLRSWGYDPALLRAAPRSEPQHREAA